MLHKTFEQVADQARQMKIFIICVIGKRNGAVELCLGGLVAVTVVAIPNLTRARDLDDTTHSKGRTYL